MELTRGLIRCGAGSIARVAGSSPICRATPTPSTPRTPPRTPPVTPPCGAPRHSGRGVAGHLSSFGGVEGLAECFKFYRSCVRDSPSCARAPSRTAKVARPASTTTSRLAARSRDGLAQFPEREMLVTFQVQALAAMGRTDELKAAIAQRVRLSTEMQRTAMRRRLSLMAVRELRAHGHAEDAAPLLATTLAVAQRDAASDTTRELRAMYGDLLYLAGRYREAQTVYTELVARDPMNAELLGSLGAAAHRAGDVGTRAAIEGRLALAKAPWMYGEPSYARARLAALRSRPAEAIDLLEAASREGQALHFSYVRRSRDAHADEDFASLSCERRFTDLLAPR